MGFDLTLVCLGELATVRDATPPMPVLPGVGVNLRTGEVFPIADCSMERGPDLNLRTARTLAASGTRCLACSPSTTASESSLQLGRSPTSQCGLLTSGSASRTTSLFSLSALARRQL